MHSSSTYSALLCLLAWAAAASQIPQTVFLDKQQANSVISRQKRNTGDAKASTLEQACMEKVCTYEEARRFFQDSYRTDIFWSVYIDGDQCAEKPCQNGAMCSDSVGGYDCVCKSGFSGVHCESDQTQCPLDKDKGCSQFCKPSYVSYKCSCALGWKISTTDAQKCVAKAEYPCGKVSSLSQWAQRQTGIVQSDFEGIACTSSECPWHALLKSPESAGFCSGVILTDSVVLTTAQCASKYASFQVAVGTRSTDSQTDGQTLDVKKVVPHPRYVSGRAENDLAVLQLQGRVRFSRYVTAACVAESDFADSILMSGDLPAVVTGWKEPTETPAFQGPLTLNQLAYKQLPQCVDALPGLITNRMGCTAARAKADCTMSPGSPVLTLYRDVFFLTGVVSQPPGADCTKGYIFQKVSRYLGWLKTVATLR